MSEDRVIQALRALAESDRAGQAAPETETLLIREFRKHQSRRVRRRVVVAVAAAASIALAVFAVTNRPLQVHRPVVAASPRVPEIAVEPAPAVVTAPPSVRRSNVSSRQRPRETVTGFFPWMDSALPFDRGQLLRVELPAGVMRSAGLPVPDDHLGDLIQADVLVGEEGLPRAIRFVKSDMH